MNSQNFEKYTNHDSSHYHMKTSWMAISQMNFQGIMWRYHRLPVMLLLFPTSPQWAYTKLHKIYKTKNTEKSQNSQKEKSQKLHTTQFKQELHKKYQISSHHTMITFQVTFNQNSFHGVMWRNLWLLAMLLTFPHSTLIWLTKCLIPSNGAKNLFD